MNYTVHEILQASILEWVAFPFSSGSSWPRDPTRVSCIAGGFFTNWAISYICKDIYCKCLAWILKRAYMLSCAGLLAPHWTVAFRFLCPGDFSVKNAEVGCHFLLQGIFMIQRSNLQLLHLLLGRWVFYHWIQSPGKPQFLSRWCKFKLKPKSVLAHVFKLFSTPRSRNRYTCIFVISHC